MNSTVSSPRISIHREEFTHVGWTDGRVTVREIGRRDVKLNYRDDDDARCPYHGLYDLARRLRRTHVGSSV